MLSAHITRDEYEGLSIQSKQYPIKLNFSKCSNVTGIKARAGVTLHPDVKSTHKCFVMMLTNLAEPDWVTVPCEVKMLHLVFCDMLRIRHVLDNITRELVQQHQVCSDKAFLQWNACYAIFWAHNGTLQKNLCEPTNWTAIISLVTSLVHAVSETLPPVIFNRNCTSGKVCRITKQKYMKLRSTSYESAAEGFLVLPEHKRNLSVESNIYKCKAGGAVSCVFLCDEKVDCPFDSSDEEHCVCGKESSTNLCQRMKDSGNRTVCSPLYYLTQDNTCQKYFGDSKTPTLSGFDKSSTFACNNGTEIHKMLLDDFVADCGSEAEDELHLSSLLTHKTFDSCTKPSEVPCRAGHSKCYNLTDICVYQLNVLTFLVPCRNGEHLQNCQLFECNMFFFKCIKSFCIPLSYVCDQKWDCPAGDDEAPHVCGINPICISLFKCMNTKLTCIPFGNICNRKVDCPFGDDELFCELIHVKCPLNPSCHCLLFAVYCRNTVLIPVVSSFPHTSVLISDSEIKSVSSVLRAFYKANVFILANNSISKICGFNFSTNLIKLDLGLNSLQHLKQNCFSALVLLASLSINDNCISVVEKNSFNNLSQLRFLNISNNPLLCIPPNFIIYSMNLSVISLLNITFTEIHPEALQNVFGATILTPDFHLCCIVPSQSNCTADHPWFISCKDLLPESEMKVCFIVICISLLLLNITSALLNTLTQQLKKSFRVTICCVNINEELVGIYLGVIWVADVVLKDTFVVSEQIWRSSPGCFAAFSVLVFYSVSIQAFNIILSLSRLMVVVFPFNTQFKRTKFVGKCLLLICILSLLFCVSVVLTANFAVEVLPSTLCIPFADPSDNVLLVTIFALFVGVTQCFTSIAIITMHCVLFSSVLKSDKNITKSKSDDSNTALLVQLALLSTSNVLCWLPTSVVFLSALFITKYRTELLIWTIVGGLPINSLLFPCIFSGTVIKNYFLSK